MKIFWNEVPRRVIVPFIICCSPRTVVAKRVAFFGIRALKGGKFHPKLNMTTRLIANKYREGKVKRTLKRELKVLEIVKGEANVAVDSRFRIALSVCLKLFHQVTGGGVNLSLRSASVSGKVVATHAPDANSRTWCAT